MTDYSDQQAKDNESQVRSWYKEFSETTHFNSLSKIEKSNVGFVIEIFTDFMYGYEGETPEEWTTENLRFVCTDLMPRKISAEPSLFSTISPILNVFFKFLKEKKYINQAEELELAAQKLGSTIVKNAKNPKNWGMEKSLFM